MTVKDFFLVLNIYPKTKVSIIQGERKIPAESFLDLVGVLDKKIINIYAGDGILEIRVES